MPTEAEFKAFQNSLRGTDFWQEDNITKERFPLEEDYQAFIAWRFKKMREFEKELNTPMPRSKYIDLVSSINFSDSDARSELMTLALKPVYPIPIGVDDRDVSYRLIPRVGLRPDRMISSVESDILSTDTLGVNTNVQPREPELPAWRSKLGLPEMSSDSNESDWKDGGFVFHQLGALEYQFSKPTDPLGADPATKELWSFSGFDVVIIFRSDGVSEGIYIICNFYPVYPDGEQAETKVIDDLWGYLPWERGNKHRRRVFMAKIADNFSELGSDHKLNLSEVYEYPLEIVEAMITSSGAFVRTTVARN